MPAARWFSYKIVINNVSSAPPLYQWNDMVLVLIARKNLHSFKKPWHFIINLFISIYGLFFKRPTSEYLNISRGFWYIISVLELTPSIVWGIGLHTLNYTMCGMIWRTNNRWNIRKMILDRNSGILYTWGKLTCICVCQKYALISWV